MDPAGALAFPSCARSCRSQFLFVLHLLPEHVGRCGPFLLCFFLCGLRLLCLGRFGLRFLRRFLLRGLPEEVQAPLGNVEQEQQQGQAGQQLRQVRPLPRGPVRDRRTLYT